MTRWLAVCILMAVTATVEAQRAPKMLFEATHCLVTEKQDWLNLREVADMSLLLGYYVDRKSYPAEQYLYVVLYDSGAREGGLVFGLDVKQQKGARVFRVQNNARFKKLKGEVVFTDPPLGGTWTQEHLMQAINQIEKASTFRLRVEDARRPIESVRCESYAD